MQGPSSAVAPSERKNLGGGTTDSDLQRQRILLLTDYLPTGIGGTEVEVSLLAKCLNEMGYEVAVVAVVQGPSTDLVLQDEVIADHVHLWYIKVNLSHPFVDLDFMKWASKRPLYWFKLGFRIFRDTLTSDIISFPRSELVMLISFVKNAFYWDGILEQTASLTPPQLIHSFSGSGTVTAKLNRTTEDIKRVFAYTGFPLSGWRNSLCIQSSNGVILQEDGSIEEGLGSIKGLGIPLWRTFSKVDSDIVAEAKTLDFDRVRQKLDIPKGGKVISIVGRLDPFKAIDEIVRAFPIIARQVPEATLVLCTPSPPYAIIWDENYPRMIESLISSLERDVRERIRWIRTGLPRAQTLKLMSESDVTVFCSPYSNGNIALREAMSVGAAIVASDSPGTEYFIENGETGIFYRAGDPNSLAQAVLRTLESPRLQSRLRSGARTRSQQEKFQLQDSLEDLENFYSQVLDQH